MQTEFRSENELDNQIMIQIYYKNKYLA